MRTGNVFYKKKLAGTIAESDEGEFVFNYNKKYIQEHPSKFISFTMPVRSEA